MNWAWANSLDQLWRSATFPMWLTLAAAGFFALILLVTLLRAEKSVANGALTVITLLAIGVAGAATIRGFGTGGGEEGAPAETAAFSPTSAPLPALSCIDDLAGEAVLTACEKVLFGSAEIGRRGRLLCRLADHAAERLGRRRNRQQEHDARLAGAASRRRARSLWIGGACAAHPRPLHTVECAAFRSMTDHSQIVANMDERVYDGLVSRYAPLWNTPVAPAPATVAALPPSMPTGRPTNADFPSAASTPPVSIMTPEPGPARRPRAAAPACDLATAVATSAGSRAVGCQEAAETSGGAGSACAGNTSSTSSADSGSRACGLKRLILCASR